MNKWIIAACALSALFLGFYFGQRNTPVAEHSQEKIMPTDRAVVEKAIPVITLTPLSPTATPKTFQIPSSPEIERRIQALNPSVRSMIEKNKLMDYFQRLAPQFPEDESGNNLLLMTTFLELHERARTDESKLVDVKIKELEANPDEAMLALGIVMQRMGHHFPEEKQYMLQFVAKLDVPDEEKAELLVAEAKRPFDSSEASGKARFNPSMALFVLGNLYQGKEKHLYPILRDILVAHKEHPEIQKIVLHEYGRFDSARSQELYRELGFAP
ncbi:MAG: hypothetical protein HYV97_15165 [Bdellovibrio sp.]|nr:hypothetical protein [Bdellovibrio sp.]